MINPLDLEYVDDRSSAPLPAGWFRRLTSVASQSECPAPDLWGMGPEASFRIAMIGALERARDVALVSAFLLADEPLAKAMLRASERGVRVYTLCASEQRIGKALRADDEFEQRMANKHRELLDRFTGRVLVRTAENLHAKFLVTDPQEAEIATGFISTANFNLALTDNVELGVRLYGADACDLAALFNQAFWLGAERELAEKGQLRAIAPPPGEPPPPRGTSVLTTFRSNLSLRDKVMTMVSQARSRIQLATYGIEADHEVSFALIAALKRGVEVTILTRPRPAIEKAVTILAQAGARIRAHDKLHAKALAVDGVALIMSANIEEAGLNTGFEVGYVLPEQLARAVSAILDEWAEAFPWSFRHDACRGDHLGDFLPASKGLRDGVARIVHTDIVACPDQIAPDALKLGAAPHPAFKAPIRENLIPQRIIYKWKAVPPKLPKGATPHNGSTTTGGSKFQPQAYKHDGKNYILATENSDIHSLRMAAEQANATVVVK